MIGLHRSIAVNTGSLISFNGFVFMHCLCCCRLVVGLGLIDYSDLFYPLTNSEFVQYYVFHFSNNLKLNVKCKITYFIISLANSKNLYCGISCLCTVLAYNVNFHSYVMCGSSKIIPLSYISFRSTLTTTQGRSIKVQYLLAMDAKYILRVLRLVCGLLVTSRWLDGRGISFDA